LSFNPTDIKDARRRQNDVARMTRGKYKHKKALREQQHAEGAHLEAETEMVQGEKIGESMSLRGMIERSSLTDWLLALFTLALVVTAIYQIMITGRQLHAMRQDQRAWVKITSPEPLATGEGIPVVAPVHMLNTGKTPALNYIGEAVVKLVPIKQEPDFDYSQLDHGHTNGGILYPNDPRDINASIYAKDAWANNNPSPTPLTLSHDDYKSFYDGKSYIVVYARVRFLDIYGVSHSTQFCNWSTNAASPTIKCAEYNRVDDN
jgi:hypothetical protein